MDIYKIAALARKCFENRQIDYRKLAMHYQGYNYVDNIGSFFNRANKLFPKLNCGIASVYLNKKIPNSKIVNGLYENYQHTFLLINDTTVVDITADQYDGPKIYVGPITLPWST